MEAITFESLGLSQEMLKALEKKGYGYPTTIQAEAIPHFMKWEDVIAATFSKNPPSTAIAATIKLSAIVEQAPYKPRCGICIFRSGNDEPMH